MKTVHKVMITVTLLGSVCTIAGFQLFDIKLYELLGSNDSNGPSIGGEQDKEDSEKDIKVSISRVIISLESILLDSDKVQFIEANINSMPDSLSLKELNSIIGQFLRDDYKLRVTKILSPRVKSNFSDNELKEFMDLFLESKSKRMGVGMLNNASDSF